MALKSQNVRWTILTALFKLLPSNATPQWSRIADKPIADMFRNLADPTGWKGFFAEAYATALQQEIMAHGSYVPELVETVEQYAKPTSTETWSDLEQFIQADLRQFAIT